MLRLGSRSFSSCLPLKSDFSHTIIGGGIVGVAIAAELLKIPGNNVCLLEKNSHLGMETTSRNSEVIHAGIYYPKTSLKSKLCIAGKEKIYYNHERNQLPVELQKCGKLIVGQSDNDLQYLHKLYENCQDLNIPVEFQSTQLMHKKYPLIKGDSFLLSPSTGIISSHLFTLYFESVFEQNNGTLATNTLVEGVEYDKNFSNYTIHTRDLISNDVFEISTDNLINSAGLFAPEISNMVLPPQRHVKSYFAKGSYFGYASIPLKNITDKLIYPVPNPNAVSLGTHLTFDLGGQVRFGPDLEWLDVDNAHNIDYTPNPHNLQLAFEAIQTYFPSIKLGDLAPSYSGIRPKLASETGSKNQFQDFYIEHETDFPGFVNLLAIESPGLTSSWAIADYVVDLYK